MATVVWMAVFFLLVAELCITLILVLPLPKVIRNFIARKIFTYDLAKRVRFISNFIVLGLCLAVFDAISTLRHLEQREETAEANQGPYPDRVGYIGVSLDKQRKFRAERNMYLASFALTLVFVIARLVELMQQLAQREEESDTLERRLKSIGDQAAAANSNVTDISPTSPTDSSLRQRTNVDKTD